MTNVLLYLSISRCESWIDKRVPYCTSHKAMEFGTSISYDVLMPPPMVERSRLTIDLSITM